MYALSVHLESKNGMENRLIEEFNRITGMTSTDYQGLTQSSAADWHDGSLLHRSKEWIEALHASRDKVVTIIPDYDADGVMSGMTVYAALYALGWTKVHIYYPTMETGYGLSEESLSEALALYPDTEVIITTDNGIKAYAGVKKAKELGLTVLVTDHHPGVEEEPEADVIVDPNSYYDQTYPFKSISGGEVAYKLMVTYADTYAQDRQIQLVRALYPFAGISAVADMMEMLDENRFLVKETVRFLSQFHVDNNAPQEYLRPFKGLWALLQELQDQGKLKYGLDADTIGFYISPMLNASRRVMVTSKYAFQVFMQDDVLQARKYVRDLWMINEYRKKRSKELSQAAISNWRGFDTLVTVIDAGVGYAGLVSGQLTSVFDLPTIVFSAEVTGEGLLVYDDALSDEMVLHGSGRAPEWFPFNRAMRAIEERNPEWFVSWGGHEGAIGCAIHARYLHAFRVALAYEVGQVIESLKHSSVQLVKDVIELTDEDARFVPAYCDYLRSLEPFGTGFKRVPVAYMIEMGTLLDLRLMGSEKQHLKLQTSAFSVIIWNYRDKLHIEKILDGARGSFVTVVGSVGVNEWNGRVTSQVLVDRIL